MYFHTIPVNKYILIAEDDEDDQLLMRSAFKDIGETVELVFVQNGIELITFFGELEKVGLQNLPLLLIVDLNMPKKTGREALTQLVGKPYFRNFCTVIFSTTGNEFEKQRCRELGIEHYFVKPPNYSQLVQTIVLFSRMAHNPSGIPEQW